MSNTLLTEQTLLNSLPSAVEWAAKYWSNRLIRPDLACDWAQVALQDLDFAIKAIFAGLLFELDQPKANFVDGMKRLEAKLYRLQMAKTHN